MELNYLKDKLFYDFYDNVKDCIDPELMDCISLSTYYLLCHKVGTSIRFDKVFAPAFKCDLDSVVDYIKRHVDYSFFLVKLSTRVDLVGKSSLLDLFK